MVDFYTTGLSSKNEELYIRGISLKDIAKKHGTPLYVTNVDRAVDNFKRIQHAFTQAYSNTKVKFAMKSNSNLNLLTALRKAGCEIDTVSPNELSLALRAGFKPEQIVFNGAGASVEDFEKIAKSKATVNFDSISDFETYCKFAVPEIATFRINPGSGLGHHKYVVTAGEEARFGIWKEEAIQAYALAKRYGVKRFGIHMHVGSNSFNVNEFTAPLEKLLLIAGEIKRKVGIEFEYINIGGGFGVPYKPEQDELDLGAFAKELSKTLTAGLKDQNLGLPMLYLEPGRYISADSTVLLVKVNSVKQTPYRSFIFVDAGMNALIRPALYGSYHHVLVNGKLDDEEEKVYDVVSTICESADFLARDRLLPLVEKGDLLVVLTAGAYGYVMSSNYNLRDKPKEIIIEKGNAMASKSMI